MKDRNRLRTLGAAACFSAATAFGQIDWTPANSTTREWLNEVTWSHDQLLVFTGRDTLLTSPDGSVWNKSWTNCDLRAVTWAGGGYIAVGSRPFEDPLRHSTGAVFGSPDGKAWTTLDPSPNLHSDDLKDIVWADTQFVAVGEPSIILTSRDGTNWIPRTPIPNAAGSYNSVAWTGRRWVAVGVDQSIGVDRSAVLTSPDGVAWETRTTDGKNALSDVVWTGTQLVAVGNKGTILTSPDGLVWTSRNSGTTAWLYSVAWTGHQLVAVGGALGEPPVILSSPDGVAWTDRTPALSGSLNSVAWTGQRLVAVGSNGGILTSPEDPSSVRSHGPLSRDFILRAGHGDLQYSLPESVRGRSASAAIYSLSGESIVTQAMAPGRKGRVPVRQLAQGKYLFELLADGDSFTRLFEIPR